MVTDKNDKPGSVYDYKLHITVLIITIISLEIGTINIPLYGSFKLAILPIIPALIISIFVYVLKPISWIGLKESKVASSVMLLLVSPLIVKLAIFSGQNIELLFYVGPILILKELGSIGTILVGLPIALLLGFKRESIGMTSSICREPQLAVLVEEYGFDSEEVKGYFIVYVISLVLGSLFISILANVLCYVIPLHPYSYALATGLGSVSLNIAAVSSLSALYPSLTDKLLAFSGISNIIAMIFNIYVYIFIALPLTEKLYKMLSPIINRKK